MKTEVYDIREVALYGPRGGLIRSYWQVLNQDGAVVVPRTSKKKALKYCEEHNPRT